MLGPIRNARQTKVNEAAIPQSRAQTGAGLWLLGHRGSK